MLRLASCLLACFAGIAAAAPCEAPPEPAVGRECRGELATLERRARELLATHTELHPDVRAIRRSIEEKRECADGQPSGRAEPPAEIVVDAGSPRQALMGFGATWPGSVFHQDRITESQWRRAIGLLANDIGARVGEAPPVVEPVREGTGRTVEGFSRPLSFTSTEKLFQHYGRHAPEGMSDFFPFAAINVRWAHPWLKTLRTDDPRLYQEEVAAKAVAVVADWKARSGREPEYLQLWNEPLSGNGELGGGTLAEMVETMRIASRRLRQAGFERVRFVVPAEETVGETLKAMRAIAADGEVMATVGAIAYHVYPYGSEYVYVPRLLATRSQGREFEQPVRERLELRNLSDVLGIPVWMTEVSNGYARTGPGGRRDTAIPDSIDWIVGRAIHIHDELRHAGASAFFGMMSIWSDLQDRDHSPGAGARNLRSEGDHLVLIDTTTDSVFMGGVGHAIGHYGRWLKRGARYLDSRSSSPLVLVSPFRDGERLVAVLVNMARVPVRASLRVKGGELAGGASLEQSRTGACRDRLAPVEPREGALELELAPWSVTTLAAPLR